MRWILHLAVFCIIVTGSAILGTVANMYLYEDPAPLPRAAAIVVLSGPGSEPTPIGQTRERVTRGAALWDAGLAPILVMSGGGASIAEFGEPDSAGMAAQAKDLGVRADAIREESGSYSTLQNAWFTAALPGIDTTAPVIVVTHRYHLPRAWASFRWAGFEDITLIAADTGTPDIIPDVFSEGLKWPLNVLRAVAASTALWAGVSETTVHPWLR